MPKRTRGKALSIAPLPVLFVSAALVSTLLSVGSDLQAFSLFSPSTWWGGGVPTSAPIESPAVEPVIAPDIQAIPSKTIPVPPDDFQSTPLIKKCAFPGQSCEGIPCCGSMQCNDGRCGPAEIPYPCTCTMKTCEEGPTCIGNCEAESGCEAACAAPQKWLCATDEGPCTVIAACTPDLAKCVGACGEGECDELLAKAQQICPNPCTAGGGSCDADDQCCSGMQCIEGQCGLPEPERCEQGYYCGDDYKGTQLPGDCPVDQLSYKNEDCSFATCSNSEDEEPNPGADEDDPHCFQCSACAAEQIALHEEDPDVALPKDINEGSFTYHPEFDETKPCSEQNQEEGSDLLGQVITNLPNPCPGQPGARCRTNADCAQQPHPQECFPPNRPANEWGRCRRISFKLVVLPNRVPLCSNDPKYDELPWRNYVQGTYNGTPGSADPYASARQNCVNHSVRQVACCRKDYQVPFAQGTQRGYCGGTRYVAAGRPVDNWIIFNGDRLTDQNTGFGTNPCTNVANSNSIMYETGAPPPNGVQCSATNDGNDVNATCGGAYRAVYKQDLGQPVCTNDPFWIPCRYRERGPGGQEVCIEGVLAPPYLPRVADNQSPYGSKREAGRLALTASFQRLVHCQAAVSGTENCAKAGESCTNKVCCKPSGFNLNPLRCKDEICQVNVTQDGGGGCLPAGSSCNDNRGPSCCRSLSCSANECCLPPAGAGSGLNRQSLITAIALLVPQNNNNNLTPPEIPLGDGAQGECWRRLTGTRQLSFIGEYGTWVYNTANQLYAQRCRWPWNLTQRCRVFFNTFQAELLRIKAIFEKLVGRR